MSTKRQRELARARWERQQQRRLKDKRKSRQRQKILAAALSVALIAALGVFVTDWFRDDDPDEALDAANPPVVCEYPTVEAVDTGGKEVTPPPSIAATTGSHTATITTNQGDVVLELDPAAAPCTVNSFVHLVQSGYYDATTCHRMLVGEGGNVLQCGDPTGTGSGGPGYQFADENLEGATYTAGVLAMANSGPGTNGSQFFMVFGDSGFGPSYPPFGRITSGLDILEQIAAGGVTGDKNDVPVTNVEIESVTITTA